jgi:hypothetical protein
MTVHRRGRLHGLSRGSDSDQLTGSTEAHPLILPAYDAARWTAAATVEHPPNEMRPQVLLRSARHDRFRSGAAFQPAPQYLPKLKADDVWAHWARLNGSDRITIPAAVTVQLGLLTYPVGPGGLDADGSGLYNALNQPVYAFSDHSCALIIGPAPPDTICVHWLFLDANTPGSRSSKPGSTRGEEG